MTIAQLGPGPMVTSLPVEDPLSDAVYAGYITVDGRTRALIESRSTRQGEYLDAGATWHDYRIVAITPRQVTVSVNGQACILPISDAFNAVPLTASAPGSLRDGADAIGAQVVAVGGEAAMSQDAVTAYSEEIRSAAMSLEQSTLALDLDIQMSDQMATVDSPAIELGVQVINDFD